MIGISQIVERVERTAVAKLCLRATERAVHLASFQTAFIYVQHAISLLDARCWRDEYKLSMNLYNSAAEVAYCSGNIDDVFRSLEETFKHARSFEDTLRGQATKVYALGSSGRMKEAVTTGLDVLRELGETFPSKPSSLRIRFEIMRVKRRLKDKTNESLLRLPLIDDSEKLAAMQILNMTFFNAFSTYEKVAPLLVLRMITLTLDYGLSSISCMGFVVFAALLCGYVRKERGRMA
jgi:predicted ATPase